jgi:hypothetical protein
MSYKVTDTVVVDQNKNINNIGVTTSAILDASKDPGTGIGTDYTHSIFGNGWRLSAPASTTYYKLATLPVGSSGNTFDHLVINGVLGSWTSTNQTPFEIYFSNRNSFNIKYISYGNVRSDVRILGISTNSTVEIWAQHQASQFTKLTYSIANSLQVIPVPSPTSTTTAPTGTTVFDSSTATPRFIINDSDNVGIGTTNPSDKLHVLGSNIRVDNATGTLTFWNGTGFFGSIGIAAGFGPTNSDLVIRADVSRSLIFQTGGVNDRGRIDANGTFLVGSATSTGTASQRLQVTGGAYISGNLGIGTTNPTVALQLSPTASISNVGSGITLAGTVGSALTVAQFLHFNTNTSYLRIKATRNATGSDWLSASTKLVQVIDVTEQGYIEYNPNGANYGMAFGSGASEWARFLQNGNI